MSAGLPPVQFQIDHEEIMKDLVNAKNDGQGGGISHSESRKVYYNNYHRFVKGTNG